MKQYLITKATIIDKKDIRRDKLSCNIITPDIEMERKRLIREFDCYTVHFAFQEIEEIIDSKLTQ
ncbi:MAG: hypothetical protein AB2L20_14770 [Mangrovibacterium sp.]